ncbi:MAG: hypothetical protein IKL46_04900 [Clostridia bacterium]|nr:hypothetical protein [Clostridia bacterium]
MRIYLNLQLKDGIEPKELLKFGFVPKYDTDTGEIKEYYRKFWINEQEKRHFTFVLHRDWHSKLFKRFEYEAWMTGFNWSEVATPECMQMLYELIINGIVEPTKRTAINNGDKIK